MISIATRFRPFSHRPFSKCVLPGTDLVVKVSSDLLEIGDVEIPLESDGLTLQMDLEKNCVWVFRKGFRLRIVASKEGVSVVSADETTFFPLKVHFHLPGEIERLSFGVHKSQDWDLVLRRMDMKEILPILYHLSQKVPLVHLLSKGKELCYRSSFDEMLVPKKENALQEAFEGIRSRFVVEDGKRIKLLPDTPFLAGRMMNVQTQFGSLDMHWVKGELQRVTMHVKKESEVLLDLPPEVRSFRVKEQLHDRGVVRLRDAVLSLSKGRLYLDRFIK